MNEKRFGLVPINKNLELAEEKEIVYLSELNCFGFKYHGEIIAPYEISKNKLDNHVNNLGDAIHFKLTSNIDLENDGFYIDNENKNIFSKFNKTIKCLGKFTNIEKNDIHTKHLNDDIQTIISNEMDNENMKTINERLLRIDNSIVELYYDLILRQKTDTSNLFNKFYIDNNNYPKSLFTIDYTKLSIYSNITKELNTITLKGIDYEIVPNDTFILQDYKKYNKLLILNVSKSDSMTYLEVSGITDDFDKSNTILYKSNITVDNISKTLNEGLLPMMDQTISSYPITHDHFNSIDILGSVCDNNKHIVYNDHTIFVTYDTDHIYINNIYNNIINVTTIDIEGVSDCFSYIHNDTVKVLYHKNESVYEYNNDTNESSIISKGNYARAVIDNRGNIHYFITTDLEIIHIIKDYNNNITKNYNIMKNLSNKDCTDVLYDADNNIVYALMLYSQTGKMKDYELHLFKSCDYGYTFRIINITGYEAIEEFSKLNLMKDKLMITYTSNNLGKLGSCDYKNNKPRLMSDDGSNGEVWNLYDLNSIHDVMMDDNEYRNIHHMDTVCNNNDIGIMYVIKGALMYNIYSSNGIIQMNPRFTDKINDNISYVNILNGKYTVICKDDKFTILNHHQLQVESEISTNKMGKGDEYFITLIPNTVLGINNIDFFIDLNETLYDMTVIIRTNIGDFTITKLDMVIVDNNVTIRYHNETQFEIKEVLIYIKNPFNKIQKIKSIIGTVH